MISDPCTSFLTSELTSFTTLSLSYLTHELTAVLCPALRNTDQLYEILTSFKIVTKDQDRSIAK